MELDELPARYAPHPRLSLHRKPTSECVNFKEQAYFGVLSGETLLATRLTTSTTNKERSP